jgi:hypothetical protein
MRRLWPTGEPDLPADPLFNPPQWFPEGGPLPDLPPPGVAARRKRVEDPGLAAGLPPHRAPARVRVIPRTRYRFSYIPAAGNSQFVPLRQDIDASGWIKGLLVVRVSAMSGFAIGTVAVQVRNISRSAEDPSVVFGSGTLSPQPSPMAQVELSGAAPELGLDTLATAVSPLLEVGLSIEHQSAVAPATLAFTIAVDLIGRYT